MTRSITRTASRRAASAAFRRSGCALAYVLAAIVAIAPTAHALDLRSWDARELAVLDLVNAQRLHRGVGPVLGDSRLHDAARGHSVDMLSRDFFGHTNPDGVTAAARVSAAGYDWRSTGENIAAGYGRRFSGNRITEAAPEIAAREVMYGTSNLQSVRDFVTANNLGDAQDLDWAGIGRGWTDSTWNAWRAARGGSGGWMGSSGHRGSILRGGYTDVGAGYAFSASDGGSVNFGTYWTLNFASGDSRPPDEPGPPPPPPPGGIPADPDVLLTILSLLLDVDD